VAGVPGRCRVSPDAAVGADLTLRQREVLAVIRESVERRGYAPSYREIGDAVGLASTSSVSYQVAALVRKGLLRQAPSRQRALQVIGVPPDCGAPVQGTPASGVIATVVDGADLILSGLYILAGLLPAPEEPSAEALDLARKLDGQLPELPEAGRGVAP
ncbi:hypothetical protein ACFQ07_08840, partial [Actinomadura adrarensis]